MPPASSIVGTSGSNFYLIPVVTAIGRTFPDLIAGKAPPPSKRTTAQAPAMVSVIVGLLPL